MAAKTRTPHETWKAIEKMADDDEIDRLNAMTEEELDAELLARIAAAKNDPKFASPVAALFRKRGEEESTDEELEAILDEIELLKKLADDE